jgi:O-antigen ligase
MVNMEFGDKRLKRLNKVLLLLFIIQLPVQLIKFFFYGIAEDSIGTYATHGGGATTVIPLMALGYLSGYYFLHKKNYKLLILSVGFIAYGIIGAKYALLFLYPISFIALYYINVIKIKGFQIPGDIYRSLVVLLLIVSVGIIVIKFQVRANREYSVGGSVDLSYALKSSLEYTTSTSHFHPELATGRFSTTKMTFGYLFEESFIRICLGYGPGVLTRLSHKVIEEYKTREEKIAGSYGHTGAINIVMDSGIIGLVLILIIYSAFLNNCLKLYKKEKDPYWKAFASGSLFFSIVNIFMFLCYNDVMINGDTIPPVFFYCMATVYVRLKAVERSNALE